MDLSALMALSQSGPLPVSASVLYPPQQRPRALVKAGVVSSNTGTPTGAGETLKAEETKPVGVDSSRMAAREYRKSILSHTMKLTSAAITMHRYCYCEEENRENSAYFQNLNFKKWKT